MQSVTTALAHIGDAVDHVVGTGNAKTGNSGAEIVSTVSGTTFKIVRLSPEVGNDYGADANVEVIVITHELEG